MRQMLLIGSWKVISNIAEIKYYFEQSLHHMMQVPVNCYPLISSYFHQYINSASHYYDLQIKCPYMATVINKTLRFYTSQRSFF
jgi:hypothetical protein